MKAITFSATLLLCVFTLPFNQNKAFSLETPQLREVTNMVTELCAGGSHSGEKSSYQVSGEGEVGVSILIKALIDAGIEGRFIINKTEWENIEAIASDRRTQAGQNNCLSVVLPIMIEALSSSSDRISFPYPLSPYATCFSHSKTGFCNSCRANVNLNNKKSTLVQGKTWKFVCPNMDPSRKYTLRLDASTWVSRAPFDLNTVGSWIQLAMRNSNGSDASREPLQKNKANSPIDESLWIEQAEPNETNLQFYLGFSHCQAGGDQHGANSLCSLKGTVTAE